MGKFNDEVSNATGPVGYGLTNDCMFLFVFQNNIQALRGLISSVLHLNPSDIKEIEVSNPIEIGRAYDMKNYCLDLKLKFNNNTIINIEMQVLNKGNWPERSLSYLCRNYDNLNKGTDYKNVFSAIHIGFIDFTLFLDEPEFCATYMMQNIKTHKIYSSKFVLKVVELNQTKLATEEDRMYKIDQWARLFKATTWEDLRMCASNDAAMESAVNMMYEYNSEEAVRDMCRAREEAIAYERYAEDRIKQLEAEQEVYITELEFKDAEIKTKDAEIKTKEVELKSKDARIEELLMEIENLRKVSENK